MTSKEAHQLLLKQVSTDQEFYKSLKRLDEGEEDQDDDGDGGDDDDSGGGDKMVYYDGIDSSKTVDEVIKDTIKCTPADSLAAIYVDDNSVLLSKSDAEDRGAGTNLDMYLDMYIGPEFSTCNATGGWMEWDSK